MAQIVINVDGVDMLFSPVNAHALKPGDMIHMDIVGAARITATQQDDGCALLGLSNGRGVGEILVGWNLPVLRAVGANSGRGGAA